MSDTQRPQTLSGRVVRVVVIGAAAAAVDTLLVRAEYHHRPLSIALYLEAWALWSVFACLAWIPSALLDAVTRRPTSSSADHVRAALRHLAWTVAPVLLHARLDSFTSLGGDMSALADWRPWAQCAGIVSALVIACVVAGRFLARVQPNKLAAVVAVLAVGSGLGVSFHSGEGPQSSALAADSKPNVLCLVWDTTRAESLSLYGYERGTTPNLAKLAQDSLVFDNARSVSTYTLSSHLSMLTGVYPSHHGARMTRQRFHPFQTPTIVRKFREAGYRTGAFVGTDVLRAQSGVSFAFEEYDDRVDPWVTYTFAWALVHDLQSLLASRFPALHQNGLPHWIQDFQRPASEVLRNAEAWLANGDPRPWFCFINLYDVHWPYVPELSARNKWVAPYDGIVDGYTLRGNRVVANKYKPVERDHVHLRELYDAEMYALDLEVDRFLGQLDLQRTAVLITSDHGEAFGEAGRYEHADILECQTRVPLLVRPAGGTAPRKEPAPVSGIDVAPTLLALAELSGEAAMVGENLLGEIDPKRLVLVEDRDHPDPKKVKLALYDGAWKLVRKGLGEAQTWHLYDTTVDALEQHDLAEHQPEVLARLRAELEALRARWNADDERDAQGSSVENADALKALGYANSDHEEAPPPAPEPRSDAPRAKQ